MLIGFLALPLIASALFFYNAVRAEPAAHAYETAPPCADIAAASGCIRHESGTIVGIEHDSGWGRTTEISLELSGGTRSARMTDVLPAQEWFRVGLPVDVTLYEENVTMLGYNGQQVETDANPVVHQHDLLISGCIALAVGLVLNVGTFVGVKRRRH